MKIGEIAEKTGITRDAIRLYEKYGIVINVSRPNPYNSYKDYPPINIKRVSMVLKMKKLGFTLKEAKAMLDNLTDGNIVDLDKKLAFLAQKVKEVDVKIVALKETKLLLLQRMEMLKRKKEK